ncbi:MAG: ABC transporter permease [Rhodothermaceae bacterium]
MFNRIKAIAKKELKQLSRDTRMLFVIFFFPVFLLVVFGYAINFDVKNILLAVYDQEQSEMSGELVKLINSNEYFTINNVIKKDSEIKEILDQKKSQVVLVIPKDFSRSLYDKERKAKIQVLVDGVDGNTASIISKYFQGITSKFNEETGKEILLKKGIRKKLPIDFQPTIWYNPSLDTTKYMIPGLIAMILIITSVISISLSLVKEKERGTTEQLNVSSLSVLELLIGKSFPYILISIIDAVFVLIAGFVLFDLTIAGSIFMLSLSTLIFILASISLGIFISVVADSQQVAFIMSTFATLLPSVILSGFIFPIESMPPIVQLLTNITPAKFFIEIERNIILKGVGINIFWDQIVYLILFMFFFLLLSVIIGRKKEAH